MFLIDSTIHLLTWTYAPKALREALDLLDSFISSDSKEILLGTISAMALVPENRRDEARRTLIDAHLFEILLPEDLLHGLALYPNCPAA
jgi:hypothetical protein